MRVWIKYLLGIVAVVVIAAYGEFVVDFLGPRSQLKNENALAAITSTSYGERDAKIKEARAKYGDRVRANDDVPAGALDGKWTITVDGSVIEEGRIVVKLAGMEATVCLAACEPAKTVKPSFASCPVATIAFDRRKSSWTSGGAAPGASPTCAGAASRTWASPASTAAKSGN